MPFVGNDGVQVHYQVEGSGESLVLLHGFSDSLETWREYGYVDALSDDFQVVLIDARGHGLSDKPHDPVQYRLPSLVRDVTSVLDELAVPTAHVFGISMGGRYGFGIAKHAPDRLRSLMIGAALPWRNLDRTAAFISFLEQGPEAFVPVWESQATISEALKARLRSNDEKALIAMVSSRVEVDDDTEDALADLARPYRLIAGDADTLAPYSEIVQFAERLPEGSLVTLPGVNHLESMQRLDLVLPHVRALIDSAEGHART